jgi:hypothetical protein
MEWTLARIDDWNVVLKSRHTSFSLQAHQLKFRFHHLSNAAAAGEKENYWY